MKVEENWNRLLECFIRSRQGNILALNLSFSPCSYKVRVGKESSETQGSDLTSAETVLFSEESENGEQGPPA